MGIVVGWTGRKDDLAYLIWPSRVPSWLHTPALRTSRLDLLIPPKPPGSSLNHEGNHKSYHAVSLLSHVHLSIHPNTQARSIGHRTW